ncbi:MULTISPECIES: hypothetical protein [unclassified Mucilaginibacter]|uniref:hypothetical protein n=1 Tax=unclassified Mucilaginibacter TaxID=2617802 RepID=UPI002AC99954|nr:MULTISPECIES: hypothetical protein [unclassified Mucilaginibacter]MEB0299999.1 hypothetical protein [Mucilaginibacter sp. 5C4]WPX21813.1 hypothetical protein RHM67_10995 [Mucilaginibacter sp. 5C4]
MKVLRNILFITLIFIGFRSKSQTLLNRDLSEINKVILSQKGGLLHKSKKSAKFGYVTPPEGNTCIFNTTCYFNPKHKCFKYINKYWGNDLPTKEINGLKNSYPGLKAIVNDSTWIDYNQKIRVTLVNDKHIHAVYYLIIETFDLKTNK